MNTTQTWAQLGLRGDVLITLLGSLGVSLCAFLIYGFLARALGMAALGEFFLIRRTAFLSLGAVLLGLTIALPYYVAKGGARFYGRTAIILFALLTLPLIGLESSILRFSVFKDYAGVALTFFLFTAAYALQSLTFGLLRGQLKMVQANILQLLGTGLLPLGLSILFYPRGILFLLQAIALGTILVSIAFLLPQIVGGTEDTISSKSGQLLGYGIQRAPAFLFQFVLLGAVPLLLVRDTGQPQIAYYYSGVNLLRLFTILVGPLGIVLLPRMSKAISAGRQAKVALGITSLGRLVLLCGLPLTILLVDNSRTILTLWLGADGAAGTAVVQSLLFALPFFLVMEVLRSPVDAAASRGYNTIIYGLAAVVLLGSFYLLKSVGQESLAAGLKSFLAAQMTLAGLGLYYINKLYRIKLLNWGYLATLVAIGAGCFLLIKGLNAVASGWSGLIVECLAVAGLLLVYLAKSPSAWVVQVRQWVLAR